MHPQQDTIMISETKGVSVIGIDSIIRIEALSNYSKIFLRCGKTLVVTKVLKQMQEMLAGKGFARIHRSHLVNTAFIEVFNLLDLNVVLNNNEQLCISRRKRTAMKKEITGLNEFNDSWKNKSNNALA